MLRAVLWEPDLVARRTVVSVLKLGGYEVVDQASSAEEALSLTGRSRPNVLLFAVPDDGGDWATRLAEAREQTPDTTIVAFVEHEALGNKARAAGVATVLDTSGLGYLDELNAVLVRVKAEAHDGDAPTESEPEREADEWLPLREAAQAAGVPLGRLRRWCDRGMVPYRKESGRRLVQVDDVQARAAAEAAEDGTPPAAEPDSTVAPEVAPEPEPEPEPEPVSPFDQDTPPEPEPVTVVDPIFPEPAEDPAERPPLELTWPPTHTAAPPRRSYDVIPNDDDERRGRRRR
jgi:CheY-like chemotaxis protein